MPKRKCLFNSDLQTKFPMFKKGKYGWEAFCTVCSRTISIANKGVSDINVHLSTLKHKKNEKNQESTSYVATDPVRSTSEDLLIAAAEGAFVYHTVSHHMSFNALEYTCALNREIFSESDTLNVTCNQTKATAIATGVLSPLSVEELKSDLQYIPFISVATDVCNHGSTKLIPLIIQYFDVNKNGITTKVLEIESTENETSDTIAGLIITQLRQHDLLSKYVAFGGDNCKTHFGGIKGYGTNNVFQKLKENLNPNLIGVGCSARVIENAVQHACDLLTVDVESVVLKIYNFFAIYKVQTEALKEFSETAEVEYKQLLHSKRRWLSLFPAVERLLKLYSPLNDYFKSIDRPPVLIKEFFENPLSEAFLFLIHSIMHTVHSKIQELEKIDNSVLETRSILASITKSLDERIKESFVPLNVQNIINKEDEKTKLEFKKCTQDFYKDIKTYIEEWMTPFKQYEKFDWMFLPKINTNTEWTCIEDTVLYLKDKNIDIDDSKLFDEWVNLKAFCENLTELDKIFNSNQLWIQFFSSSNANSCSELLKIAQYVFCIPAHNGNVERICSLTTQQWKEERNLLSVETISAIIKIKFNFQEYSCIDFYQFILNREDILKAIIESDDRKNIHIKTEK